jgi:hypothetical protein
MAWIKVYDELWEHHKLYKLRDITGISILELVAHLVSLWHFTLRNAWRDGDLEPWGDSGIEAASRWQSTQGVFVKALRESGFLDGFVVHDWLEIAGGLVVERLYNEQRRKYGVSTASKRRKTPARVDKSRVEKSRVQLTTDSAGKPRKRDAFQIFMDRIFKDFLNIDPKDKSVVGAAYRRFGRAGRDIMAFAGNDPEKAYQGVDAIADYMQSKGLTWTFDTAAKWFPDWLNGGLRDAKKENYPGGNR